MRVMISNLIAYDVNLSQNDMVGGMPAISAFLGLGSVLLHDAGFDRWEVRVLPVIHDLQRTMGRTRPELRMADKTVSEGWMLEDMPGTVRFSLILDLPGPCEIDDLIMSLEGRRLAGGVIFPDRVETGLKVAVISKDGKGLRGLRRGRAVIPVPNSPVTFGDPGTILPVGIAYSPADPEPGRPCSDFPSFPGFMVPCAIGYRFLSRPGEVPKMKGLRKPDIPHAFVEPGAGIAELLSVRNPRLTGASETCLDELFWRWCTGHDHVTFHPAYNPDHKE